MYSTDQFKTAPSTPFRMNSNKLCPIGLSQLELKQIQGLHFLMQIDFGISFPAEMYTQTRMVLPGNCSTTFMYKRHTFHGFISFYSCFQIHFPSY